MKQKHRDITVGGKKYGWIVATIIEDNIVNRLTIYKDKKPWIRHSFESNTIVTPSMVAELIAKNNQTEQ